MENKIYLPDGTIMTYEEYLEYIANNWTYLVRKDWESKSDSLSFLYFA